MRSLISTGYRKPSHHHHYLHWNANTTGIRHILYWRRQTPGTHVMPVCQWIHTTIACWLTELLTGSKRTLPLCWLWVNIIPVERQPPPPIIIQWFRFDVIIRTCLVSSWRHHTSWWWRRSGIFYFAINGINKHWWHHVPSCTRFDSINPLRFPSPELTYVAVSSQTWQSEDTSVVAVPRNQFELRPKDEEEGGQQ